ncbi:hypothetical protein [Asticcacaulis sp.]|uniref:hypothetical protein n=1 Tax=Asticcacaulis sp. TaxID=1872648 RepID=UPI002BA20A31|nr:hypothetical protein [Asticcacaulis sp.]HTM82058.1 hypothetical protein [Asticcacaulis sp.]
MKPELLIPGNSQSAWLWPTPLSAPLDDIERFDWVEGSFSVITRPPETLGPRQRAPQSIQSKRNTWPSGHIGKSWGWGAINLLHHR